MGIARSGQGSFSEKVETSDRPLAVSDLLETPTMSRIVGAKSMFATSASLTPMGTTPSQAMMRGTLTPGCRMLAPWANQ